MKNDKTDFTQGITQLRYITMVVLAMVIERLADTQFACYIFVIFSLKLRLLIVNLKWAVSCSTPD